MTATEVIASTIETQRVASASISAALAKDIVKALEVAGFVVLDECARCHEDPRAHWCADLEETFN